MGEGSISLLLTDLLTNGGNSSIKRAKQNHYRAAKMTAKGPLTSQYISTQGTRLGLSNFFSLLVCFL